MKTTLQAPAKGHVAYLDYLRILATLAVIWVHVAAQNWEAVAVTTSIWQIFNIANSAGRWCVGIFCMISGVLFLDNDKPLPLKKLLGRNIPRLAAAFVFWSAVYALIHLLEGHALPEVLAAFVGGHFHMWFLFMIAGLYLAAPLLRRITQSKEAMEYFLVACFLFGLLFPRCIHLLRCLELPYSITLLVDTVAADLDNLNVPFVHTYAFYFVLGFYLSRYEVSRPLRRIIWGLGVAGYLVTVGLTSWYSRKTGSGSVEFYAGGSLNVFCMTMAIFLLGKYRFSRLSPGETGKKWLKNLSKCTFGMYLVHSLVLRGFQDILGWHTLAFHPALAIPTLTIAVAAVSWLIAWAVGKIPVLGKYVV